MNNLTQIIHKLEEECQKIAGRVIADNEDMNDPEFYDVKDYIYTRIESELPQYDLYQSIITILEKIDEGKMVKKVFIRFGEIPENEKSLNHLTEKREKGISVYEGIEDDGKYSVIMPPLTYSCCVSLSGVLDRQAYLVDGVVIGSGSDGECLLKDCKIIKAINVSTNYLGGGE